MADSASGRAKARVLRLIEKRYPELSLREQLMVTRVISEVIEAYLREHVIAPILQEIFAEEKSS